ncbi:MAG: glycosyltransferase family 9 protein [Janthinobacterium lividum]
MERLHGVAKIAVLRPNAVGDFVFALPALHALKHAYPKAELVLLGKPWHARFLAGRPGPVDRVIVMPPVPGVGAPAGHVDDTAEDAVGRDAIGAIDAFVAQMRAEEFDIVAQMYGGGRYSNPFALRLGGRMTIGARADGAAAPDRWCAHVEPGNRRLALLEIASLVEASAPPPATRELAVTRADREEAYRILAPDRHRPLVLLQPGSSDLRRCWPAAKFAAVGDALAAAGARVAVNGTGGEAALVRQVIQAMRHPAADLSGALGLGGLCGLLERSALLVSNDTGPLHLALALGTPAVGVFWHTNAIDGAPLQPSLLRAAVSSRTRCTACGPDNRRDRCAHQESFVDEVTAEEVEGMALALLRERMASSGQGPPHRETMPAWKGRPPW